MGRWFFRGLGLVLAAFVVFFVDQVRRMDRSPAQRGPAAVAPGQPIPEPPLDAKEVERYGTDYIETRRAFLAKVYASTEVSELRTAFCELLSTLKPSADGKPWPSREHVWALLRKRPDVQYRVDITFDPFVTLRYGVLLVPLPSGKRLLVLEEHPHLYPSEDADRYLSITLADADGKHRGLTLSTDAFVAPDAKEKLIKRRAPPESAVSVGLRVRWAPNASDEGLLLAGESVSVWDFLVHPTDGGYRAPREPLRSAPQSLPIGCEGPR